jgi:hypothetical protein
MDGSCGTNWGHKMAIGFLFLENLKRRDHFKIYA